MVDELGSETTLDTTAAFCFLIVGGGVPARSLPLTFESKVGLRSSSGWDFAFALAAKTFVLRDFGDSTRAFFLRLGLVAREGALDVRGDMIERVRNSL